MHDDMRDPCEGWPLAPCGSEDECEHLRHRRVARDIRRRRADGYEIAERGESPQEGERYGCEAIESAV